MGDKDKPIEADFKVIDNRKDEAPVPAKVENDNAFVTIFQIAAQKNYDPAFIEKMMDLQERQEGKVAKKAFFDAFANFKADMPPVKKDKYNKFFDSWYTSLGMLLDTYNPPLGNNGLSLQFPTPNQDDTSMTVECRLSHRLGHTETVSMTGPIDVAAIGKQSGQRSRNPMQDLKSTFTYLRSATCEAILGVAGTEATANDDGNGAGSGSTEYISEELLGELKAECLKRAVNEKKFLKHFEIDAIEHLPAKRFNEAMKLVKAKSIPKTTREPGCDDE